jgi:ankyrin repeat protein
VDASWASTGLRGGRGRILDAPVSTKTLRSAMAAPAPVAVFGTAEVFSLLQAKDADGLTKLFQSIRKKKDEKAVIAAANAVQPTSDSGHTPLHHAAETGQFDCVYALVTAGANPNTFDKQKWTPLHAAAASYHLDICALLLARGASQNSVNVQGTS